MEWREKKNSQIEKIYERDIKIKLSLVQSEKFQETMSLPLLYSGILTEKYGTETSTLQRM